MFLGKKIFEIPPFFQTQPGDLGKKVHACSLRFSAPKFTADLKRLHPEINMYTGSFSSHQLHYRKVISFHLFKFMSKFTFKHCLFLWFLFKVVKKFCRKFSCLSYKAFFKFQTVETSRHFVFKAGAFTYMN